MFGKGVVVVWLVRKIQNASPFSETRIDFEIK